MILRTLALGTALVAAPALAADGKPGRVDPARCHVQNVHTPAGKPVHSAPIVHCPEDRRIAQREAPAPRPDAPRTARD